MRYVGLWLCGGWLLFGASAASAATRVFFTSQESVEKELVRLIDESRSSIDMALFRFTSRPLAQAISRARARGAKIRIILDGHLEAEQGTQDLRSAFTKDEIRRVDGKRGGTQGIMHHKFVLFDQRRLVTGSFNWTAGAEHRNYENALLTDEVNVVSAFGREFDRIWCRADSMPPALSGSNPSAPVNPDSTRKSHVPWHLWKKKIHRWRSRRSHHRSGILWP